MVVYFICSLPLLEWDAYVTKKCFCLLLILGSGIDGDGEAEDIFGIFIDFPFSFGNLYVSSRERPLYGYVRIGGFFILGDTLTYASRPPDTRSGLPSF